MNINLWDETIKKLDAHGKSWKDVKSVCLEDVCLSKENFRDIAMAVEYNNGYGTARVRKDLKIVGDSFWLERDEYDGSEWWAYREKPEIPLKFRYITDLLTKE